MGLWFDDIEVPAISECIFNGQKKSYFKFNDTLVWKKSTYTSDNIPQNLTATKGQDGFIQITWLKPNGGTPVSYNLYRDGSKYKSNIKDVYYKDSGLAEGSIHTYYVTAVYSDGTESLPSNSDEGSTMAPSGSQTFTEDGVFTVPNGVTQLRVCMIGGGGGGTVCIKHGNNLPAYGGTAGQLKEEIVTVIPGQKINVKVGIGGAGGTYNSPQGRNGTTSSFGSIYSLGGKSTHTGEGQITNPETGCGMPPNLDGISQNCSIKTYGGQGSIFGEGGNGGFLGVITYIYRDVLYTICTPDCYTGGFKPKTVKAKSGKGYGSGGGGFEIYCSSYTPGNTYYTEYPAGAGANGVVIVSWGNLTLTQNEENEENSISNILGYDILDERYLNIIRYSNIKRKGFVQPLINVDDPNFKIESFFMLEPISEENNVN